MMRLMLAAAMLGCVAAPGQAMSVSEFLAKVKGLKAKGMLAIGSPDIKLLRDEMKGVTEAYRADILAARNAGKPSHSCPPPKGQAKMTSDELIAELEKIPAVQRGASMKTAFYAIMKKRYPC